MTFFTASATDGDELASVPDADGWSAGFWQPTARKHMQRNETRGRAIRTFITSSEGLDISFSKDTPISDEVNFTRAKSRGFLNCRGRSSLTRFHCGTESAFETGHRDSRHEF